MHFYRDFDKFDYLVVIDEQFKKLIEMGGKEGVIEGAKLILPPDEECVEETTDAQTQVHECDARSDTTAILKLFCLGFDFVMTDEQKNTDNIYKGSEGYGEETHATYEDSKHRVNYLLNLLMKQYKDVSLHLLL